MGKQSSNNVRPVREDKSKKVDYTLIPIEALTREAKQMQLGNLKYARDDWQNEVMERPERYRQSLLRHTYQYLRGDRDEDHLAAARACTAILMWYEAYLLNVKKMRRKN